MQNSVRKVRTCARGALMGEQKNEGSCVLVVISVDDDDIDL
jgi:hypothetical protein